MNKFEYPGKGSTPSYVEQLRQVERDERFLDDTHWICPKTLILFPGKYYLMMMTSDPLISEGKYPYLSRDGKIWGTRADLISKEREQNSAHSYCKSFDVTRRYVTSGGVERTSTLEGVQIKRNGRVSVAVVVENPALTSLMKLVNYPVKINNKAEILVTEENFKTHFKVIKFYSGD